MDGVVAIENEVSEDIQDVYEFGQTARIQKRNPPLQLYTLHF